MELKKLVLLCQHKVHMKSTTWSEIQDSTISSALNFSFLRILLQSKRKSSNCNKHNRKKKWLYRKSVSLLFWFAEN